MSDLKCARYLVSLAERDLRCFQGMVDVALRGDDAAGYWAQQAAERLLKAWVACIGELYPLTHDLKAQLDLVEKRSSDAAQFRDLEPLSPFAEDYRYKFLPEDAEPLDRHGLALRLNALLERVGAEIAAAEPQVDHRT